ncbi:MAG: hypothetical protein ACR2GL_02880 [Thermoleophilaceae bacterium]
MTQSHGISRSGASVEDDFRRLTGAAKADRAALGDALLDGRYVEVKRASSNTLNQVRAVKYIPLVAYYEPKAQWYVVPASEVVRQCARRSRGQHTENPFESATLSIRDLGTSAVPAGSNLKACVLKAIEEADRYPKLRELMDQVLLESTDLAASSVARVRDALRDSGLL